MVCFCCVSLQLHAFVRHIWQCKTTARARFNEKTSFPGIDIHETALSLRTWGSLYWKDGIFILGRTPDNRPRTVCIFLWIRYSSFMCWEVPSQTLQWRQNERDGVWNQQPHDCLLNRLFKAQIKENNKAPRHWPLCGEFTGDWWIHRTKVQ